MRCRRIAKWIIISSLLGASPIATSHAWAQSTTPPPPPADYTYEEWPVKVWNGSLSAGLALTSGNTNTSTVNASYELVRDAKQLVVFKSTGLFLRSQNNDTRTVDRTSADARLEFRLTKRLSAFGQTSFLRDRFRQLDYLIAPTVGLGYALVDTNATKFNVDFSMGTAFEHRLGPEVRRDVTTSAAYLIGERVTQRITNHARFTQVFTGLWKLDDFGDALYTASAGIAASITSRSELKAEILNTYKTEPELVTLEKRDVSVLMSFVYKF